MISCEYCGKEYKMQFHLKKHIVNCKAVKDVEVDNVLPEDVSRKIKKIEDAIRSTYDAKSRYDMECEIKVLKGK